MRKVIFTFVCVGAALLAQDNVDPAAPVEGLTSTTPVVEPRLEPMSLSQRFEWAAKTSISSKRLAGYMISSGIATATNSPHEYGPHWDGYGKRVGLRASTGATGLMLEAGIGAFFGEDPRYVRATGRPLKGRLSNIVKLTFMAYNRDGEIVPAYGRYIAIPTNSYLTNLWRPDSHATVEKGLYRIPLSFVDRLISNAVTEFWPDLTKPFHRGK